MDGGKIAIIVFILIILAFIIFVQIIEMSNRKSERKKLYKNLNEPKEKSGKYLSR